MRISEILNEATELKSTINAVSTDIGNTISNVYSKLEIMLHDYVKKNGSPDGFGFIGGGVGARWMAENGNRLISELHNLAKQGGNNTTELKQYLLQRDTGFFKIANRLPEILITLGKRLNSDSLVRNATAWKNQQIKYRAMLAGSEDVPAINHANAPKQKPQSAIPAQNNAAEQIVNDILRKLKPGDAGEIRNIISRSGNKLLALQQELQKRNIQI